MSLSLADKVTLRAVGLGLTAFALAMLVMLAPPLALVIFVFPALGVAGWGLLWCGLLALVAWWLVIRLYEFARALLSHASLALFSARMLRAA